MEFKVLRGQRFINWLEEDSTYNQLDTNIRRGFPDTNKRQNATGPVSITKLEYIPYEDGQLRAQAEAVSQGNRYQPVIMFRDVQYEPENLPTNVTLRAANGQEFHIQPIPLAQVNVRVRCTCLDFYFRFSSYNSSDNSLAGAAPQPYLAKGERPPANPQQVPGVCKHIIKVVDRLKQSGVVT